MNNFKIEIKRESTHQVDVVHINMMQAISLCVVTYGDRGLSKVDDKGNSSSIEISIEIIPGLNYESE